MFDVWMFFNLQQHPLGLGLLAPVALLGWLFGGQAVGVHYSQLLKVAPAQLLRGARREN